MPADPSRVQAVFLAAVELSDGAAQIAFLERECGADAELRERVNRLLAAHREATFLGASAGAAVPGDATRSFGDSAGGESFRRSQSAATEGTVIAGRFKLRQQIGEGGMGAVWMADQTEPVKRKVAVKLIRVERGQSKTILARFEAERQAIALMDHPHIAKLLDAGTTDDGAPFFVMELVKGVPLNDYCDQQKLTIPERLKLFSQICSAVQHAHQKGIIHRDLKPSNILVESHDGQPVPKVIDFGLAKATTGLQLSEQSMFTAFGSVMGTPLYMAPEQANFNAVDVDTRADVYALGVILYELLTGTTPLTRESLKQAALDELLWLVREQEAPTPSSRLSSAQTTPSVAASRQIEPAKLGRFVKGELDWIVMKALSKERARRYETAIEFAKDIERFLNHEPVLAGPPGTSYRLQKFVRRHRGQVIGASCVLLALVAGVVGTTFGLIEAKKQERIAQAAAEEERQAKVREGERADGERRAKEAAQRAVEAEKAARLAEQQERQYAQAIADFVKQDFLALTSVEGQVRFGGQGLTRHATLSDLLNRAAEKLKERKNLDPRIEAELCWIVGVNYRADGKLDHAIPFLQRAVELRRQCLPADHPETLVAIGSLALAYAYSGRLDLAIPLNEESYKRHQATLGPRHPHTLASMNNLAGSYRLDGQLDKALPLYEEALKLTAAQQGPDHFDTLSVQHNLAACYRAIGQTRRAVSLEEETAQKMTKQLGRAHPDTLASMDSLAQSYEGIGRLDLALPLFEETLRLRKSTLGADHPDTLRSMGNLALGYNLLRKSELAVPLLEETLKRTKALQGAEDPDTLAAIANLAFGYATARKFEQALPLYEEVVGLKKTILGVDHPDTVKTMSSLAWAYQEAGQFDRALPLLEEAAERMTIQLGAEHPDVLRNANNLATGLHRAGRSDEALALFQATLKKQRANLGPDHPDVFASMNNMAAVYDGLQRQSEGVALLEELLPLIKKKLGADHPDTIATTGNLGVSYLEVGRAAESIPLLELVYQASKTQPAHRGVADFLLAAYAQVGQSDKAAQVVEELLVDARKTWPKDSLRLAGALAQCATALLQARRFVEAESLLRECLAIREMKEPDDWRTFNARSLLGGALLGQKKYADAEPLLLSGYEGMEARQMTIPPQGSTRLPEAIDRLIEFYAATDKSDEVEKWRAVRAKRPEIAPMPREKQ